MVVDVVQAVETDGPEILALRHAAEDWLAERGIIQWRPREVSVEQVEQQISRGEFFVARDREQSRIVGALRLIWSDLWSGPIRTSLPLRARIGYRSRILGNLDGRTLTRLGPSTVRGRERAVPAARLCRNQRAVAPLLLGRRFYRGRAS